MIGLCCWFSFYPRLLTAAIYDAEEARWKEEQAKEMPGIVARTYRITNPNVDGRLVKRDRPAPPEHGQSFARAAR